LNHYYKISRLPWILYQWLARSIFDPVSAAWFLQISTLIAANLFLYDGFRRLFGRDAAFIGALLFTANLFVHANGGADYHNALATPLLIMTWWASIYAAQAPQNWKAETLLGVLAALTVHTNIVMVNLAPVFAAQYLYFYHLNHGRLPNFGQSTATVAAGAIAVTALLGLINWAVGRNFLFFMTLVNFTAVYVADPSHQKTWWNPWSNGWYWTKQYLGQFVGGLILAALICIDVWRQRTQRSSVDRAALVLAISYIAAAAIWLGWQTAGHTALDWPYFALPLAIPLSILGGAAAARWLNVSFTSTLSWRFIAATLTLAPLFLFPYGISAILDRLSGPIVPAIIFSAAALAAFLGRSRLIGAVLFVCLTTAGHLLYGATAKWFAFDRCDAAANLTKSIDRAHRYLREQGVPFGQIQIMGELSETIPSGMRCTHSASVANMQNIGSAITSTGFGYLAAPWVAKDIAGIPDTRIAEVNAGDNLIAFVTNDDARIERLIARMSSMGPQYAVTKGSGFGAGPVRFQVYLLKRVGSAS
jgi:4-amino-4-deoxy-L-arabinose transferase-like glycosyltransferase